MALSLIEKIKVQREVSDRVTGIQNASSLIEKIRLQRDLVSGIEKLGGNVGLGSTEPEPTPPSTADEEKRRLAAQKRREAKIAKLKASEYAAGDFSDWETAMQWAKKNEIDKDFYPVLRSSARSRSDKFALKKLPEKTPMNVEVFEFNDDGSHDGNRYYLVKGLPSYIYAYAAALSKESKHLDKPPRYAVEQWMGEGDEEGVWIPTNILGQLVKNAGLTITGGIYNQEYLDQDLANVESDEEAVPSTDLIAEYNAGNFNNSDVDAFTDIMNEVSELGLDLDSIRKGAKDWARAHPELFDQERTS